MTDRPLVDTLLAMRGVWHDVLTARDPQGRVVVDDPHGGTPGPFPYENLVYCDFDGTHWVQTNVTFRGRPAKWRSFRATVEGDILYFHKLGPEAPTHIGVGAGPGLIWFLPEAIDDAWQRYSEPDYIQVEGDTRRRSTVLYRDGRFVRTMEVVGTRLAATAERRVALDPRGTDGPVHEEISVTHAFQGGHNE
jgi:hypothetical protein